MENKENHCANKPNFKTKAAKSSLENEQLCQVYEETLMPKARELLLARVEANAFWEKRIALEEHEERVLRSLIEQLKLRLAQGKLTFEQRKSEILQKWATFRAQTAEKGKHKTALETAFLEIQASNAQLQREHQECMAELLFTQRQLEEV